MKRAGAFFLLACLPFLTATTFIIKEGDVEVGRYEENDGRTGEEIVPLDQVNRKPVPVKKETRMEYSSEGGYTAEKVETGRLVPDKNLTWSVSGIVLGLLTLEPLGGATLYFSSGVDRIAVPVNQFGMFTAKLPVPENALIYEVDIDPPKGYSKKFWVYRKRKFSSFSYDGRLNVAYGIPTIQTISGHSLGIEIGVVPEKLPPEKPITV